MINNNKTTKITNHTDIWDFKTFAGSSIFFEISNAFEDSLADEDGLEGLPEADGS